MTLRHQQPTTLKFVLGYYCGETSALGDYYVATNVLGDHFVLFNSEICAYCGISIFNSNAGGLWVTEE